MATTPRIPADLAAGFEMMVEDGDTPAARIAIPTELSRLAAIPIMSEGSFQIDPVVHECIRLFNANYNGCTYCQNARQAVFPLTREHRVGTLLMFAVRNIFSRPERLAATVRELADAGELPPEIADNPDPLGFLVHEGGASSVVDAAYRFVRHEPGVDVVLFGTGDVGHLRTNIGSLLKPPLPQADRDRLAALFGHLVGVGLDAPHLTPLSRRARSV